jgi:molybdopterin-guanine dinucleotide biosynthesis protein A
MPQGIQPAGAGAGDSGLMGGYVLTGGASRRMGRDKARLPWRGVTLVEWIASQVSEAVGSATLVGAPGRYTDLGLPGIHEDYSGSGPLSGIEAALRHSPFALNLIVACDMPFLTAEFLRGLAEAAVVAGADVCATVNAGGEPEPLCAVYHRRTLREVRRALEEGRWKARDLLGQWRMEGRVEAWKCDDAKIVTNTNRPEDWDALQRSGN